MLQTFRLTALAVALCASAASAAESACTAETYTTVCRDGGRELRIIRNTTSPSGQYGVAWEVPSDGTAEDWVRGGETDGSKLAGSAFRAIGGRIGDMLLGAGGMPLHVAGQLRRDTWGGREKIELQIEDVADPRRQK